MRDPLRERVTAHQLHSTRRSRAAALLLILSLLVTGNVFWNLRQTGIAMAGDAACGMEEHTHTVDCYATAPICGMDFSAGSGAETTEPVTLDQTSAEPVLICEEEHPHAEDCYALPQAEEASPVSDVPSMELHTHTPQCYDSDPVCGKQAHVHSITCYSDLTADVETPLDWQSMFAGVVTGDLAQDLVTVAQSQVGYSESQLNFQVDDLGQRRGYTRYGAWYGFPYEDWSAMFVSFCLSYAGSTTQQTPFNIGVGSMMQLWQQQGQCADSSYLPLPGDLVFFSDSTVGILSEVSEGSLRVIQGDWQDAVCQRSISPADSTILGYGIVTVQQPAADDLPAVGDAPSQPVEEPEAPPQADETPAESDPDSDDDPEITPDSHPDSEDTPSSSSKDPNLLGTSAAFTLPDCDCPEPASSDLAEHPTTCARKYALMVLASEKSAQELYALWPQLPADCQDYVLSFLAETPDTAGKLDDLHDLLAPESGTLNADCGGTSFTLSGKVPAGAALTVAAADYSRNTLLNTCFNPNDWDYVNSFWVYDIAITVGGADWQPNEPVQLTVTNSEFAPTKEEFFCVAHLDADGNVLSTEYLTPENGTVTFTASSFSPYLFYTIEKESQGGEKVTGTNWMALRDSGWFTYWEQFLTDTPQSETDTAVPAAAPSAASATAAAPFAAAATAGQVDNKKDPSDVQIDKIGGSNTSQPDQMVEVSKTIDGTELENVFDITLTVKTQQNIQEVYRQRDLSVVIVMDISNTMTDNFGGTTRYAAAMESAENFLDQFAKETSTNSTIGYVAFNTDAHQIFGLQKCSTNAQAVKLKNTMRTKTGTIINTDKYGESHSRFTNMEAGLKMAQDMLDKSTSESKYIIFLSDGFPTTYVSSGYSGYDPYTSVGTPGTDGVFHDDVFGVHCDYGTSYSDKAAIRARTRADAIKNSGIKIFSIGVDVGGQTIQQHINSSQGKAFSVVDRTSTSYELGSATNTDAFKNWLCNSIGSGSGYYYDSTKQDELTAAYDKIFSEITLSGTASQGEWVTRDPLPLTEQNRHPEQLEFIGFYGKDGDLRGDPEKGAFQLNGTAAENGENTAEFDPKDSEISWDLKQSGYTSTKHTDGTTTYFYQLTYRVRLKNEWDGFVENNIYDTNNPTSLTYRVIEVNGQTSIPSEPRTVEYPIPAVHGYLGELAFRKTDPGGQSLAGAEFTLTHDTAACGNCRGDGLTPVVLPVYTATSNENGQVSFTNLPSGHVYTLSETKPPPGYLIDHNTYTVTVAYDEVTVTRTDNSDSAFVWNGVLINYPTTYELPATGGSGVWPWLLTGSALITGSLAAQLLRRKRRKPPPAHL